MEVSKYTVLRFDPIVDGNPELVALLKAIWPVRGTGITVSLTDLQERLKAGATVNILEIAVNGEHIVTVEAKP